MPILRFDNILLCKGVLACHFFRARKVSKSARAVRGKRFVERAEAAAKEAAKKAKEAAKKAKKDAEQAERISVATVMLKNNESMEKILLYSKLSQREVTALAAKLSA